jgi:beta-lactam-binding protein with PASTA domain
MTDPARAVGRHASVAASRMGRADGTGSREVVTPDLLGLTLAEACAAAAWAGTTLDATHVPRAHGPQGVVVAQSPSPGARIRPLWRVHVLVAERPLERTHEDD